MNLVLLFPEDFVDASRVRLTGRRMRHAATVQRARTGDDLRVGLVGGRVGQGRITALDDEGLEMDVTLDHEPPPPLPVTLLLALPRPKSLKRALQASITMGVKRIILMKTWRVEKSFWQSPALRDQSLREQAILALEQARDTVLPEIRIEKRFRPFVEDRLPEIAAGTLALAAHPGAGDSCPRSVTGAVTLAVGPEGGFIPYEIDMLRNAGFRVVGLGDRILRVEQAVPALLGRLF
jgi:RsmE family RNA methyltransferase